jgi:hypothetical protein
VLYEPGDPITHAYFPHDAIISLVNIMEDGHIVEIGVTVLHGSVGERTLLTRHLWVMRCGRTSGVQAQACGSRHEWQW